MYGKDHDYKMFQQVLVDAAGEQRGLYQLPLPLPLPLSPNYSISNADATLWQLHRRLSKHCCLLWHSATVGCRSYNSV
jgi:hypothetical protein